jgi:hypothetical protein
VKVIAGCIATGRRPTARRRSSTARPCRPEVCTTYWPARIAPLALSIATTLGSMSSGTVSSSRSQARATAVGLRAGRRAAARRCAVRGVGLAGGGDDLVAGGAEGGGEDSADATRADDAHPEGWSCVEPFVPVHRPPSGKGRCGYRTVCS